MKAHALSLLLLCTVFLAMPASLDAQTDGDSVKTGAIEQFVEATIGIDEVESASWEALYEDLAALTEQKIDLNSATREDLAALPFLSEQQVEDICEYVWRYAPLRSLMELAMIESMDAQTRKLLLQFVYIGEAAEGRTPSLKELLTRSKSQLTLTGAIPFYERRGDKNGYLGYPYRHSLRYTLTAGPQLKAGFVASQDAGEPFFANRNGWGYDYFTAYVETAKMGRVKRAVAGRYRLRMGQGLIMGGDISFGKLMTLSHLGRTDTRLRGHSSRMDADYLQGVGATIALSRHVDMTVFASYRNIDATLDSAELSNGQTETFIKTLLKTGYHRTPSEMNRKNNATEAMGGGCITYRGRRLSASVNALYGGFSHALRPDTQALFRRYQARGTHFWNASVGYGYRGRMWGLSGETAVSPASGPDGGNLALATLNMLTLKTHQDLILMALQRFYSYRYVALHAQSFSEGTAIQNESGLYLGAKWNATRQLSLMAYADYAHFPWARYLTDHPSHAFDGHFSAAWQQGGLNFTARYRLHIREKNNEDKTALVNITEHRARLQMAIDAARWNLKSQLHIVKAYAPQSSFGILVSQNIAYKWRNATLNAGLAYFNTDDYDSRLYLQEPDMRYTFAAPMLYGHGIRHMLFADIALSKALMLRAKLATTNYFDRDHISSGLQQIDHSSQTDLQLQLHWRF